MVKIESKLNNRFKRVLLKLSGESLMGDQNFGIDAKMLKHYSLQIKEIVDEGIEIAIVIGGGNIFRGLNADATGIDKVTGDYMGMLATSINGMALQSAMEKEGIFTRLVSAIEMDKIAEPYIRRRAIRHLEKGQGRDILLRYRKPLFYYRFCCCTKSK